MKKARFDTTITLGNVISIVVLLGAIGSAWFSMGTRLTLLEAQAAEWKKDHASLDTLEKIMAAKFPDELPMLGAKAIHHSGFAADAGTKAVHNFGFKLPALEVAADAAEVPRVEKAPVAAEKK